MADKGILYLIPCPIGDTPSQEVLPAANMDVIRSLDYFIVENLRSARRFLISAGIGKPVDSLEFAELSEHTRPQELDRLVRPLLDGRSAGVISEAGVPGIADPGAEIVAACHALGVTIKPLVGPSSVILALMASGLNGQSFAFNGYLPVKAEERRKAIKHFERRAAAENQSQIFIEAPYRNLRLFDDLLSVCAKDTRLTVAADILSPAEFIFTAPVHAWRGMPKPEIDRRPAVFIIL